METTLQRAARGTGTRPERVTDDLIYLRTGFVNLYLYGRPGAGDGGWVLIDTALFGFAPAIRRAAEERFGSARPHAIVLTHGHFDHVGTVRQLAEMWDVPVYAHPLELPYLTGRSAYPPPDPTVGGGGMAALSWLYPRQPIDLGGRVRALPEDGSVPGMPGWRWIHTPGHTAGHISLFREADRTLIAGDAFVTVKQESLSAVYTQRPEIHGPPAYYTPDWWQARRSVETLAALEPEIVAAGHGMPMQGAAMRADLEALAREFGRMAVPAHGRYVDAPAETDETGVVHVPARALTPAPAVMLGVGAAFATGLALSARRPRRREVHARALRRGR